ncbi:inositol-1-monophosphatase [Pseudoalteromonas aurantia]|uniref:Inositol-1-monophosphatase n=1 Tax=Pseudoalteromonas aurantia TaxID=43654 RepID=A0A5S3VDG8_9GAMM|nr:inositol-1-monophosphatase [Pseudoalteromonas aurantia]TMO63600.1 inositol-1-monophosphatase [Pseudoalteromonas aurantia]TMO70283.1 inositol-1-monophosphatase [Pseudoalteromonas aurantia]TMO77354.1 inositol-1-monophosphatase [Pseudoalteromonas aurantia]
MHPMLNIAVRAARNAGKVILRACEDLSKIEAQQKGSNDFVTNIDKDAEAIIRDTILKAFPNHSLVGEELGVIEGTDADYQWVIDPLDGTTNFIKGIPHFAVSIALKVKGRVDQAVIYDPIRSELFTASRGQGAQLNNTRIRVTKSNDIAGSVLATGFPFKQKHHLDAYTEAFKALFIHTADIRRAGSPALDMAYVAAGRIDGFFELGLKPWNTAAGELLVKEAGGMVMDFAGGAGYNHSGNVICGSPKLCQLVVKEIRPVLTESLLC